MYRKSAFGILFVIALFTGAAFINFASAEMASPNVSTTLVISQAYGGGGGSTGTYSNDYVELKNISNTTQSLNGLRLMYGSATGQFASSAINSFSLPDVTLQPGQYYLVQLGSAGSGGTALPVTPDATTTNLSMSGASGKVALVTSAFTANTCGATATPCTLPNPAIIDLVSYGAANNAEGGAPTNGGAALSSTQGNVRKNGGCTDTDNNNADFDIVFDPVPRNTSTIIACGGGGTPTPTPDSNVDFNGDGKSDWSVIRNEGGQYVWYTQNNGAAGSSFTAFGSAGDVAVPEDYDGDGKDDIAVWRAGSLGYTYILRSSNNTVQIEQFGQTGDDPRVAGDYDGDGKADVAVFRANGTAADPCGVGKAAWYYRPSGTPGTSFRYECWGQNGDVAAPGDYDGDGKYDFVVARSSGGAMTFYLKNSGGGTEYVNWGAAGDRIVPGDFDGDGKSDFAVVRAVAGQLRWYILERDGGTGNNGINWGLETDTLAPGDYDGDGKQDIAVWRGSNGTFYVRRSSDSTLLAIQWGQQGDMPAANWYVH